MKHKNPWSGWTEKKVQELAAAGKIRGYKLLSPARKNVPGEMDPAGKKKRPPGEHKFGAEVVVDEETGLRFASRKEYNRYHQLLMLRKAGMIGQLRLQVPYELNPDGSFSYIYLADFVYVDAMTGATIVEDAKGYRTKEYRKKRRLMLKVHGITIKET